MNWIALIEREGHAVSVAARHDPSAAVPACPGWDVNDLLRHLGTAHHRAALTLRERRTERVGPTEVTPPHAGTLDWYEEGLAALLVAMAAIEPDADVWTFDPADRTATFWLRRMAHETTVHRVDAQQATGAVTPIDPALAVDGVAEILQVFLPRAVRQHPDVAPTGATVHLHATDIEGEWLVAFGEGTVEVQRGHAKGDAAVRGAAVDLYLWLWGRVPLDRLEVFGDADLPAKLQHLSEV